MRYSIVSVACLLLAYPSNSRADFAGELELVPVGCESTGMCRLGQDFSFTDSANVGWQAAKGLLTDGASIPSWAQPFVGAPFEKAYIKAAVIHDHYCVRHVRPWRQTHRVFYEALRASGVNAETAGIMYFAVMVGGPKWAKLIPGRPCGAGQSCINSVEAAVSERSSVGVNEERSVLISRGAEYGTARFGNLMTRAVPELKLKGEALTPQEVEAAASTAMGDDFYFQNGAEIGSELNVEVRE